jgi:hypothetical protein
MSGNTEAHLVVATSNTGELQSGRLFLSLLPRPGSGPLPDQVAFNPARKQAVYRERRLREPSLRFGRQGPACIPDRTLI